MKKGILLFWPSFIIAVLATSVFFSIFDPAELTLHGNALFALRIQIHRRKFIIKYQFWLCVVKLCIRRGFLMIFTGFFSFW